MKRCRSDIYLFLLIATILLIFVIIVWGLTHPTVPFKEQISSYIGEDTYALNERTIAEFRPTIIEKFNEKSELVVSQVEVTQTVDLKKMGIFDFAVLNKTQSLTYSGSGNFYVDMSALGEGNVSLDEKEHTIVIQIPHAKLAPIDIDPEKFVASETQNGWLAFGEIRFTAKEYNALEREVEQKIRQSVDTKANRERADEVALSELEKIYSPIVKQVDGSYSVRIEFIN